MRISIDSFPDLWVTCRVSVVYFVVIMCLFDCEVLRSLVVCCMLCETAKVFVTIKRGLKGCGKEKVLVFCLIAIMVSPFLL